METGKRVSIPAWVVFFIFLFFPSRSFPLSEMESLRGLKGVEVLIEEFGPDLENYYLSVSQIQIDVESKLRKAGIEILTAEENEKIQPLRKPYLYIKINSYKLPFRRETFAFNIAIALNQKVLLRGHPDSKRKTFYAPTWYTSFVGGVGGKNIPEILEVLKELMDKFISAYHTANPRP